MMSSIWIPDVKECNSVRTTLPKTSSTLMYISSSWANTKFKLVLSENRFGCTLKEKRLDKSPVEVAVSIVNTCGEPTDPIFPLA